MTSNPNPFEDKKGFRWPFQLKIVIKPLQERHAVTIAVVGMIVGMLLMAREDPNLWDVELFKTLLTAVSVSGFLNMVLAFHFSANKGDEAKSENTGKAFEAITAAAQAGTSTPSEATSDAATAVADAAVDAAEQFDPERNK